MDPSWGGGAPETDPQHQRSLFSAEQEVFVLVNIVGALLCVGSVAVIAGLFLGLLTLDVLDLKIIQRASMDMDERRYAAALLPICEKRHLVLVTLLILNALAYETLPIFLDALVPSWVAILLSTTIVLLVGEIIPSGIFMGPRQLYLGYCMAPLMRALLWLLYPLAAPLAALLDHLAHDETEGDSDYNRGELSAMVRIQHEQQQRGRGVRMSRIIKPPSPNNKHLMDRADSWMALKREMLSRVREVDEENPDNDDEHQLHIAEQLLPPLHNREVQLVEGALRMKTSLVMDVYTPLTHVYAIPDDLVLDKSNITKIYAHGYSRVPVYHHIPTKDDADYADRPPAFMGFLFTRQLMLIDWDDLRPVNSLPLHRPTCVSPRMDLVNLFTVLQHEKPLMTFVCVRPDLANKALEAGKPIPVEAGLMGIVTLVDVMENLLQDRIYDEMDVRDRDLAIATLQQWAADCIKNFVRKKVSKLRSRSMSPRRSVTDAAATESTPLLK